MVPSSSRRLQADVWADAGLYVNAAAAYQAKAVPSAFQLFQLFSDAIFVTALRQQ
jgi:hypothetical protein